MKTHAPTDVAHGLNVLFQFYLFWTFCNTKSLTGTADRRRSLCEIVLQYWFGGFCIFSLIDSLFWKSLLSLKTCFFVKIVNFCVN